MFYFGGSQIIVFRLEHLQVHRRLPCLSDHNLQRLYLNILNIIIDTVHHILPEPRTLNRKVVCFLFGLADYPCCFYSFKKAKKKSQQNNHCHVSNYPILLYKHIFSQIFAFFRQFLDFCIFMFVNVIYHPVSWIHIYILILGKNCFSKQKHEFWR